MLSRKCIFTALQPGNARAAAENTRARRGGGEDGAAVTRGGGEEIRDLRKGLYASPIHVRGVVKLDGTNAVANYA